MRALRIDLSDVVVLKGRYGDPAWNNSFWSFAGTGHSEMGSNKNNTLPVKLKLPRMDSLLALNSKITPCKKNNFICRYGQILDLLTTSVDVLTLVALSKYYDPPLQCFTFKYFQLVLTVEEYERLLGWYVKDHPPFTKLDELLAFELVTEALHLSIEELKQTEKESGDNHRWFELAVKEKKALRDESDLEIQKLKLSLCNTNTKFEESLKEKYQDGLAQADMGLTSL
ncbi:hypothetical protein KIW84_034481 [Lathyrus oleraceus]|uniref:DUF7745 domain-containing protein n=1 Tax=Pisum sativum TaxID=3888 RepID=A0A9D4XZH2_PEA|nr:hypothetical protein KIW84_034481 [Pisum sativum]